MSPYETHLEQFMNRTFETAMATYRQARETNEVHRLFEGEWEQNQQSEYHERNVSLYFQYWTDHIAGYVFGGISPQRLRNDPQGILDGLRANAKVAYKDVMEWYIDPSQEYPLLKRTIELVELTRMLMIEYLHLLIEEQSSPKNPESE